MDRERFSSFRLLGGLCSSISTVEAILARRLASVLAFSVLYIIAHRSALSSLFGKAFAFCLPYRSAKSGSRVALLGELYALPYPPLAGFRLSCLTGALNPLIYSDPYSEPWKSCPRRSRS